MNYPLAVRERAVELYRKGLEPRQVRTRLSDEGIDPAPSAASIWRWAVNAEHGVEVDHHWRSPSEVAAAVRAALTSPGSLREISRQCGVSSTALSIWVRNFAPDEETRRGMNPEQLEQATLWRVEQHRRRPRKSASPQTPKPTSARAAKIASEQHVTQLDDAALPDDPEELKAMLRHERFLRLADKALFEAVMESEGKAPARRRSTAWSSLKLSSDSGRTDTK
ncbi:hypothetical protein [Corynebacterium glaucum]|uniref:hypothetical protein n=1 Tax=Corynebacterium glaucum TaxID=187491 RepID=UPI0025B4A43D|nr:hypothetical protein [Corynebacterium glaucum]